MCDERRMKDACQRHQCGARRRVDIRLRVDTGRNTVADDCRQQIGNDILVITAAGEFSLGRHEDHFEDIGIVVQVAAMVLHQASCQMRQALERWMGCVQRHQLLFEQADLLQKHRIDQCVLGVEVLEDIGG